MKRSNQIALLLASCSAIAIGSPVWAQGGGRAAQTASAPTQTNSSAGNGAPPTTGVASAKVSELVVTAQKREERIHEVGLSVVVANQAQLQSLSVNSVQDLNQITPSLEILQASG
jgi:iron complex outermembrane receptor protein